MKNSRRIVLWVMLLIVFTGVTFFAKYGIINNRVVAVVKYSQGSSGDVVRDIQQRLKDWGFYSGNVDGIYGSETSEAVMNFQKKNGLVPDGIVGSVTLEKLDLNVNKEPLTFEDATENEIRILASAIYGEGRGEPYEGQVAIGGVILNRVASPNFPNTIAGVVYQKGAFDAVADGQINLEPNESAYKAARDSLNGWDPSEGALYYWNPATATSKWIWSIPITKRIGRHVFGTK